MRPIHSNLRRNLDRKVAEIFRLWVLCLLAVSVGSVSLNAQTRTLAYVTNDSGGVGQGTLSVIDTATNSVVGSPIAVGASSPIAIAITPDGTRAVVANFDSDSVSVINTATNTLIGAPLIVGSRPRGVAITPDGTRAYIADYGGGPGPGGGVAGISVIDIATVAVVGSPIDPGVRPFNIAITPDGTHAYVTCACAGGPSFGVGVLDT